MNRNVANELYALAKQHNVSSFMELMKLMSSETSIDSRQLDILIKVDFFRDFGTIPELSRMVSIFSFFKNGTAKKIMKSKLDGQLYELVNQFATDKNKDGTEAKSFTITDMDGLLNACEQVVRSLNLQDISLKCKIQSQIEYMGYIDLTTNQAEDRRKLLVTDVYPMVSREKGTVWGYAIQTRSIGSGKTARLTVRAYTFAKTPIKRFDIIQAKELEKNKSGYWYLLDYELIA